MDRERYNASGCPDPTAYAAIRNAQRDEAAHRANRLIKGIKEMAAASGFMLTNRIELKDTSSGIVFK